MLRERYGERLISVVLFGSVARGEAKETSDIDLLIVIDGLPESSMERNMEFSKLEDEIPETRTSLIAVSPIIKTPDEVKRYPPIMLDIVEDGIILHDRDNFFRGVAQDLREKLRRLGARRVRTKDGWYWILKPDYKFGEVINIE